MSVGNLLAQFGNRPSILQQVEEQRGVKMRNRLGEMQMAVAADEMQRNADLRSAYGRLQSGDPNAEAEIAGLDPEFHQTMMGNLAELNKENRELLDQQNAAVLQEALFADTPEKWASSSLGAQGLPFESRQQVLIRGAALKDGLKTIMDFEKAGQPSNIQVDRNTGQVFGLYGGEMRPVPGSTLSPRQREGSDGPRWQTKRDSWVSPDGKTRYSILDDGTGTIRYRNETTGQDLPQLPAEAMPEHVYWNSKSGEFNRTDKIYKAAEQRAAPFREVDMVLNQLETSLASGSPVATADIRRLLASTAVGNSVRAVADLNLSTNPGDLWQRFTGNLSKFLTGEFTNEQQAKLILPYVQQMRRDFVQKNLSAIQNEARRRAGEFDLPADAATPNFGYGLPAAPAAPTSAAPPVDPASLGLVPQPDGTYDYNGTRVRVLSWGDGTDPEIEVISQ